MEQIGQSLQQLSIERNFDERLTFSDEALFWLNSFVNKSNIVDFETISIHETLWQKRFIHRNYYFVQCIINFFENIFIFILYAINHKNVHGCERGTNAKTDE